nr:hypothetical protein [Pantoea cypripedii]
MVSKKLTTTKSEQLDTSIISDDSFFLMLVFPKNLSTQYSMSVSLSKMSPHYREGNLDKKLYHLVAFENEAKQLSLASSIAKMIAGIKGSHAFLNGDFKADVYGISDVLSCYVTSMKADNANAYCQLPNQLGAKLLLPCKFIAGWGYTMTIESDHSLRDQIQALAVRKGCEWCPNFHPENIKKI